MRYASLFVVLTLALMPFGVAASTICDTYSTSLVSHWKMEEASGTRDDAKGSNDLTDNNTVTSGTGKIGTAADFERSTTEYLSITDASQTGLDNLSSFSTSLWASVETAPSAGQFFNLYGKDDNSGGSERSYEAYYKNAGGTLQIQVYVFQDGGSIYSQNTVSTDLGTATFKHIAITFDGSQSAAADKIKIYVDGSAVGSAASSNVGGGATVADNGSGAFNIGAGPEDIAGTPFDGLIDEFSFWGGRVLSSAEVTDIYNGGSGISYDCAVVGGGNQATDVIIFE